jgi:hypothetical protein
MGTIASALPESALKAELIPLGHLWAAFGDIHTLEGTPSGTRITVDVADVRVEGERLRGRMAGTAAADWGIAGPDGTFMLDVRWTMRTDDGALIYIQYDGRCDLSRGMGEPGPLYIAPRFETGDPRYAWLNTLQAVGKGRVDFEASEIRYALYEVQ